MIVLLFGCFSSAFWFSYNESIPSGVQTVENTQENIDKAKLLKKYAYDLKDSILSIQKNYNIPTTPTIENGIKEIDKMTRSLWQIQTKQVEKTVADEVLSSVVISLREINAELKPYLKKWEQDYQQELLKERTKYIQIGNRLSLLLHSFIENLSKNLSKKPRLSSKEKQVVHSLVRLNDVKTRIDQFKNINFKTKQEMKNYYIGIIQSIQKELLLIKELLG